MLAQGYKCNDIDHCLYIKQGKNGRLLLLILYVNVTILARNNIDNLAILKSKLNENFDMKDLGDAYHIFGIHIVWNKTKRLLYRSQTEYLDKVSKQLNMER